MGEVKQPILPKFWVAYQPGATPKVYTFVAYDMGAGYYYFKEYRNSMALIAKKDSELYQPGFRPMVINGGKNAAA